MSELEADKKVKKVKKVTIKKTQDGSGTSRTTTTVEEEYSTSRQEDAPG